MTRPRAAVIASEPADLAVIESALPPDEVELHVFEPATSMAALREIEPDVIVIDVLQLHLDSYSICRAIRSDAAFATVPLLVLDSRDGFESRPIAYAAGCDEVLEKPVNRHLLGYRVRSYARLCRRKRLLG